jgi:hypothetical protein
VGKSVARRRTLVEGLNKPKAERDKEEAFVFGKADKTEAEKPKPQKRKAEPKGKRGGDKVVKPKPEPKEQRDGEEPAPASPPPPIPTITGRMPLTTRIRSDLATALKRASLERQLVGQKPNTLQEILEEALEPWLKDNGYLKT